MVKASIEFDTVRDFEIDPRQGELQYRGVATNKSTGQHLEIFSPHNPDLKIGDQFTATVENTLEQNGSDSIVEVSNIQVTERAEPQ